MKKLYKSFLLIICFSFLLFMFSCSKKSKKSSKTEELSIGLSIYDLKLEIGKTYKIDAISSRENSVISWGTENDTIVSINDGLVTGLQVGDTYVYAESSGQKAYCKIKVYEGNVPAPSLELDKHSIDLYEGFELNLNVKLMFGKTEVNDGIKYTWEIDDSSVASINGGLITAISQGTAIIKVTCDYNGLILEDYCYLTVKNNDPTSLELDNDEIKLLFSDGGVQIKANKYPFNSIGEIKYQSLNTDIATVDENGYVSFVNVGDVIIKVTCGNLEKECNVSVFDKEIKTIQDFYNITNESSLHYLLANDIDFGYKIEDADFNNQNTYFAQIEYFNGVLDGNGHTISNIVCGNIIDSEKISNSAIFSECDVNSIIRNINIKNLKVGKNNTLSHCAGLALTNKGTIENIKISVSFLGNSDELSYLGGIVCDNFGLVNNSFVVIDSCDTENIGAIAGDGNNSLIKECTYISNNEINGVYKNSNSSNEISRVSFDVLLSNALAVESSNILFKNELNSINQIPEIKYISDSDKSSIELLEKFSNTDKNIFNVLTIGKYMQSVQAYQNIKDFVLIHEYSKSINLDSIVFIPGASNPDINTNEYISKKYSNEVARGSQNGSTCITLDDSAEININFIIPQLDIYQEIKIYFMVDRSTHLHLERSWTQPIAPNIWNEIVITGSGDGAYTATMTVLNLDGEYQTETIMGEVDDGYIPLISMTGGFASSGVSANIYIANCVGKEFPSDYKEQFDEDEGVLLQSLETIDDIEKITVVPGPNSSSDSSFMDHIEIGHSSVTVNRQTGSTYVKVTKECEAHIRISLPDFINYKSCTILFKVNKSIHFHIERGWTYEVLKNTWFKIIVVNNGDGTYKMTLNVINVNGENQVESVIGNISDGYVTLIAFLPNWGNAEEAKIYFGSIYAEEFSTETGTVLVPFSSNGNQEKISVVAGGNGMDDGDIEIGYSSQVSKDKQSGSTFVKVVDECEAHLRINIDSMNEYETIKVSFYTDRAIHLHIERAWTDVVKANIWNQIIITKLSDSTYQATMTVENGSDLMQTETITGNYSDGYLTIILMTSGFASNGVGANIYFSDIFGENE